MPGTHEYVYAGVPPETTVGNVALKPLQNIIGVPDIVIVGFVVAIIVHVFEIKLTQPVTVFVTCKVTTVEVVIVMLGVFAPVLHV